MKATSISIIIVVLVGFGFILSGCSPQDDPSPYLSNPVIEAADFTARALTGQTTGVANAVYTINEARVVCADEAAEYTMTLAKDNQLPGDTLLTDNPPDKSQYFRLDISAVMRILDKGACLERDPSDDRVNLTVEGYYVGENYKFSALTCSNSASISNSEIYYSSEFVVKGEVTCVYSDQMKYTFYFSDLKLR